MASDNKTYIPGVDYSTENNIVDGIDSLYSRSASSAHDRNKTFVPDMYRQMNNELMQDLPEQTVITNIKLQNRNIVGILFSISHCSRGEIFPIYIGRNTIGSSEDSDICLLEETVSPNHAVLLVRETANVDGSTNMVVSLTDYDSEYGSKVGDEQLMYDKVVCQDHDIISIGQSYQFILSILNPSVFGLHVSTEFKDTMKQTPPQDEDIVVDAKSLDTEIKGEDSITDFDFYAPSKKSGSDHSTNKTVVL